MTTISAPKPSLQLPDFCRAQALLLLVLLGVMLSMLLTLASIDSLEQFWSRLGLVSVFVLSVLLSACLLLCSAKGWLNRLHPSIALVAIFLFIQLLVLSVSWMVSAQFPELVNARDTALDSSFLFRTVAISMLASLVFLRYLVLHRQWQLQVQAETNARLTALQARIRPHFLFNTLNTVASLIQSRPDQAEQAVLDLSDLLRTGLKNQSQHSLEEELELVRGYLRIEALRLGDRLKLDWRLDAQPPLNQPLPALLIQPLMENAIVHGVSKCPDGGTLLIASNWLDTQHWQLSINNPIAEAGQSASTGHGMSVDNIRKRLALAYEQGARLDIEPDQTSMTVRLTLPFATTDPA
ncbi:MAG: histidine kinase [Pseudomonadota bacterium]